MNIPKRKFTALLSLVSTVLALATAVEVRAQQAQPAGSSSTAGKGDVQTLEKFTVTGSHIPTNETALTAGSSPVIRLDSQVIQESGLSTVSELLQNVTANNGGSVPISNNATGFTPAATSVSLRGLGADATLVLINGRRVAPYPIGNGGTTAFVDLNVIPLSEVDAIEVLKDGASAIYGADAVAGVVNIKMKRGIDGTEVVLKYGNTTNKDSSEFSASMITGAQSDKANVIVGFNYYKKNAIFNRDRDYSAIPPFLSSNASPLNLQITPAAAAEAGVTLPASLAGRTNIYAHSPAATSNTGATAPSNYIYSSGRTSTFNFNEFSMSYPRRDTRGVFAFGERKVFGTDNIFAYIDTSYTNAKTENQLAPSATGSFSTAGQTELVIPARTTTPLPLPGRTSRAAVAGAYNPFNPFNIDITGGTRARLAEFGNRIFRNSTDGLLITPGIRGENIAGKWNFDAFYSFSEVKDTSTNTLVSSSRFNRLMNANDSFFQPGSSDYLGTTVPYNPFGYYKTSIPNNAAIVHAALINTKDLDISSMNQFSAEISTADLLEIPAGSVGFAAGVDGRHEELNQYPDPYGTTGDLIGSSANAITHAQRKVWGAFIEAKIPVLRNVVGAHDLSIDAAGRHEDFVTSKQTTTVPKVGLRWQPLDQTLTLRASWSKGFREPSLFERFSSPTAGLTPIQDPRGLFPAEPEQAVTVAGNRRLAPEHTDYTNFGFVWSPQYPVVKGLSVGVDFWDVTRTGTVTNNYQDTVDRFFGKHVGGGTASGGLLPGEGVVLNPDGSINVVNSVFFNLGKTKAQGFDYFAEYEFRTNSWGRFDVRTDWSMFTHYRIQGTPGGEWGEVINQPTPEGTGSDNGYLRWQGTAEASWAYRGVKAVAIGRFKDGFWDIDNNGDPFFVRRTWYWDAQISYRFHNEMGSWLADTSVAIGGRDIFNRHPPYASGGAGNSVGYPAFLYSSEDRFWYVQVSRKF